MGLRAFLAKRVVYSVFLLLLVIMVDFFLFILMPGDPTIFLAPIDPAGGILSPEERKEREEILKRVWGYGDPYYVQLMKYMRNLLTWTFGKSILYKTDVTKAMFWRIPYTLLLIGGSTIISIIIGVILGVMAVQKRGGIFDSGAVVTSLVFNALPSFWIGMVFLLIFYINLGWFPNAGAFPREWALKGFPTPVTITNSVSLDGLRLVLTLDSGQFIKLIGGYLRHLFLPMATLVIVTAGGWLIFTRASMLEVLGEDYVLTAKAKGLTERGVMFKHVLKNASLPIVTSIALSFGFVLGGALITEAVFTYPGLGQMTFQAIMYRDYSILMAFFYVMSICVIIANIIADLLYGVLDPRIRYG